MHLLQLSSVVNYMIYFNLGGGDKYRAPVQSLLCGSIC